MFTKQGPEIAGNFWLRLPAVATAAVMRGQAAAAGEEDCKTGQISGSFPILICRVAEIDINVIYPVEAECAKTPSMPAAEGGACGIGSKS